MPSPARALLAVFALVVGGCASQPDHAALSTSENSTMVCTLTPEELQSRRAQLIPGLLGQASEVTDLENGLRLRFDNRPGLLADLVRVVDQERTCCSFLRFALTAEPNNGSITFDVTGPRGTREMLRSR